MLIAPAVVRVVQTAVVTICYATRDPYSII